ncbi:MAG: tetraacyldisaccharide 4'-kinase [Bacteroidota bacterium]
MQTNPVIQVLLAPLSWVYGMLSGLRNYFFDKGLIKSFNPDIPVIVVGNLIAGGTGKTPVIAWLSREIGSRYRIAILSRGYGRKSNGFHLADAHSTPETIGDEPLELKMLLPETIIAVDRNRKRGIQKLTSGLFGPIDLILMDDGFQHRRVKPGYSIILDAANRPMQSEKLLPAGLRRESLKSLKRGDMVVTTHIAAQADIKVNSKDIILVTGIANPQPLVDSLSQTHHIIRHLKFPDHHHYTAKDASLIASVCPQVRKPVSPMILTTGKDFVKLIRFPELRDLLLEWIPADPGIEPEVKEQIIKNILHYVEQNS